MPKGAANAEIVRSFIMFGPFLRYLRRRVRLTQRDLGIAVGYSTAQISLLENGQRLPNLTTLAALFIPALSLDEEPDLAARLLQLAAHGKNDGKTITRTVRRQITLTETTETTITSIPNLAEGMQAKSEIPNPQSPILTGHGVSNLPAERLPLNLPAPVWPLIGRERELETARALLLNPSARLLTFIGPPGVGKTRLALQLAWETHAAFAHGVHFIELAAIQEPTLVVPTLMQALEITERTDDQRAVVPFKPLRDYIRDKQMLLVLDNFEQLLAAATLVAELLTAAPSLKILVTSRAALHLYGEHEFPVPPLALPNLGQLLPFEELASLSSVALFMARAQSVRPDSTLTAENALAVAALCVQLDGLPLAIELAAAQCRHFTPQELAARLVRENPTRLKLLGHGWRNLPPRHQTLLGAIDWSYQLLEPDEQTLFARLGVFGGGFEAEAVRAIVGDGTLRGELSEGELPVPISPYPKGTMSLITNLQSLVSKSLLHLNSGQPARYTLLETLREYALAQLATWGELEISRRRHAEFFIALAEQAEPKLKTAEQKVWFERLERERGNFNGVLAWALEASNAPEAALLDQAPRHELGLRLCIALWRFWRYRCYLMEGYYWTQRALLADQNSPHPAPRRLRAQALWGLGLISALLRKQNEATAQLEESLRLWQVEEDARGIAAALTGLGMLANERGESEQAVAFQEQALALYQSENDPFGLTYAHNALGETLCGQGDYAASRAHYEASLKLSRQLGHRRGVAVALANIAQIENMQGNYPAAGRGFKESLRLFQEVGDQVNGATCLMGLGCVAAAANTPADWTQATQLFSFAEHLLQETGGKLQPADQVIIDQHIARCRERLGTAAFEAAWIGGSALSLEQAIERALTE